MANTQSKIDLLEQNSKLVAEITELKRQNSEITELKRENAEIKAENIELKTENAKLKQALEEHESRFMKLEQNDKNTELKARVAKLEQRQLQKAF